MQYNSDVFCAHPCSCCPHHNGFSFHDSEPRVYSNFSKVKGSDRYGKGQYLRGVEASHRIQAQRPRRRSAAGMDVNMSNFREENPNFRVRAPRTRVVREILEKRAAPATVMEDMGGFLVQADRQVLQTAIQMRQNFETRGPRWNSGSEVTGKITDRSTYEDEGSFVVEQGRKGYASTSSSSAGKKKTKSSSEVSEDPFPRLKRNRAKPPRVGNSEKGLKTGLLTQSDYESMHNERMFKDPPYGQVKEVSEASGLDREVKDTASSSPSSPSSKSSSKSSSKLSIKPEIKSEIKSETKSGLFSMINDIRESHASSSKSSSNSSSKSSSKSGTKLSSKSVNKSGLGSMMDDIRKSAGSSSSSSASSSDSSHSSSSSSASS